MGQGGPGRARGGRLCCHGDSCRLDRIFRSLLSICPAFTATRNLPESVISRAAMERYRRRSTPGWKDLFGARSKTGTFCNVRIWTNEQYPRIDRPIYCKSVEPASLRRKQLSSLTSHGHPRTRACDTRPTTSSSAMNETNLELSWPPVRKSVLRTN